MFLQSVEYEMRKIFERDLKYRRRSQFGRMSFHWSYSKILIQQIKDK